MARNPRNLKWKKMTVSSKLWMLITVICLIAMVVVAYSYENIGKPIWLALLVMGGTLYSCCRLIEATGIYNDNPDDLSENDDWEDELSLKN